LQIYIEEEGREGRRDKPTALRGVGRSRTQVTRIVGRFDGRENSGFFSSTLSNHRSFSGDWTGVLNRAECLGKEKRRGDSQIHREIFRKRK